MSDTTASRPASAPLSREQLTMLRDQLLGDRMELLAQIDRLESDARDDSWKEPHSDDTVETGSATSERERMLSLARNAGAMVGQIDAALDRMETGTYGLCTSCRRPIDVDRLEALPQAEQCLECRRRDERTRR